MRAYRLTLNRQLTQFFQPNAIYAPMLLPECIFHFTTSLVCDDEDKTVVTEMSDWGRKGGFEIEREIMYFN